MYRPRHVRSTETASGDNISRKESIGVISTDALNDQQVDEKGPERKESESFKREDRAGLTLIADVQYYAHLSNITVQNNTPKQGLKDGATICGEQINGTAGVGDLYAQENP